MKIIQLLDFQYSKRTSSIKRPIILSGPLQSIIMAEAGALAKGKEREVDVCFT